MQALSAYLDGIHPQRRHLLLIGASAGWMMPSAFLQRFERIDAFDIDPLAGIWFRARHGRHLRAHGVALHYHQQDAIADLPARMLLQVHDELLFEVEAGAETALIAAARATMEGANQPVVHLKVPLTVEAGTGRTWAEAH